MGDKRTHASAFVVSQDALASHIPRWMNELTVPGLAVALIENSRIAWTQGFGTVNTARGIPVEVDTPFQSASLSKPVFAYGLLHLCRQGRLELDRPLTDYVSVPDTVDTPVLHQITARMALSHTSGLPNGKHLRESMEMPYAPGERFSYSGIGYNLLQQVLETMTGQPLNTYMNDVVFKPLGMTRSSYVWLDEYKDRIADGHGVDGHPLPHHPRHEALAASSLYTTVSDYAGFLMEMVTPYHGDAAIITIMKDLHVRISPTLGWSLGWGIEETVRGEGFWHFGENYHCRSIAVGFPELGAGIVVLSGSHNGVAIYRRIIEELTGFEHPAFRFVDHFSEHMRF